MSEEPKRPSRPWFGAIVTVSIVLSSVWLLSYTLLDLGWQQSMGAWNYLIALLISAVGSRLLEFWRGDGRRLGGRPEKRDMRRRAKAAAAAEQAAEPVQEASQQEPR